MKELIINHFLNYEFIYIFLLCSIAFLLISSFIKQKSIKKISILLFSFFIVLFCFEFVLSFFYDKEVLSIYDFYFNQITNNQIYVHREIKFFDENHNQVKDTKDDLDFSIYDHYKIIYDVTYSTYGNNFRQTEGNINSEEIYVFLGCSFIFGDELNDNETLPYYFSELFDFKTNVINCGVQATSVNTTLNILNNEIFLPLIVNKNSKIKHCFYSFIGDSLNRNFRYAGKCLDGFLYKNKKWYIPTTIGKIKYIFARSYIFRKVFVPIIDEKFKQYYEDYMIESLKEMNRIVEEKYKSKLTIIVWDKDNYGEYFMKKLKEIGLDLIFLPNKFNLEEEGYRIKYDGHPTAKANEEIAQILYNHINNNNNTNILEN